jgi:hypothetical protein
MTYTIDSAKRALFLKEMQNLDKVGFGKLADHVVEGYQRATGKIEKVHKLYMRQNTTGNGEVHVYALVPAGEKAPWYKSQKMSVIKLGTLSAEGIESALASPARENEDAEFTATFYKPKPLNLKSDEEIKKAKSTMWRTARRIAGKALVIIGVLGAIAAIGYWGLSGGGVPSATAILAMTGAGVMTVGGGALWGFNHQKKEQPASSKATIFVEA